MTDISPAFSDTPDGQQVALADGSVLKILTVKRYLPQRRIVCRGVWQNQTVFAKLFIGKEALRYAHRDKAGVFALTQALIKTPVLMSEVAFSSAHGVALIFEAIEPALNAEELWQTLPLPARFDLMQQLVKTIAQHHRANLLQTDLHFKNFLVQQSTIYTLDGDGIRALSPLFKFRQKMHNLATLFSKMNVLDDEWIQDLHAIYCKEMDIPFSVKEAAHIGQLTQSKRAKIASDYAEKKVFRTCTDVIVARSFRRYSALSQAFNVVNLSAKELDHALNSSQNRLKSGNTCTVGSTHIANQNVVIKRYNIKNIWHGLKLSVSQSRAAKSWANAHRLTILNIATAKPLALIEARFGWLKRRAYFISEYIHAPDIAEFFAQTNDVLIKEKVAHETALLFYKLKLLQISHGDCKASNIKIVGGKPVLIDLDSMQAHRCKLWFEKRHIKDLKRFMQNWADSPETGAIFKVAFMQVYDETEIYQLAPILERAKIT